MIKSPCRLRIVGNFLSLNTALKTPAVTPYSAVKVSMLSPKITSQGHLILRFLFYMVLKVLTSTIRQKEIKRLTGWKEIKLLFPDALTAYI